MDDIKSKFNEKCQTEHYGENGQIFQIVLQNVLNYTFTLIVYLILHPYD